MAAIHSTPRLDPSAPAKGEPNRVVSERLLASNRSLPINSSPATQPAPLSLPQILANTQQQLELTRSTLQATAAVVDLIGKIDRASGRLAAAHQIVNHLRDFLQIPVIVFLLRTRGGCRVAAVSGLAEIDHGSHWRTLLEAAADETLSAQKQLQCPPRPEGPLAPILSHERLHAARPGEAIASQPVTDSAGRVLGVLLVSGPPAAVTSAKTCGLLAAIDGPLAAAWQRVEQAEGGFLRRTCRKCLHGRTAAKCAVVIAIAAGALSFPRPYQVHCEATAEPMLRRYIVAPHDGLLENALAAPGDIVEAEQVLALMDGREVRWELTGLGAERQQALRERDRAMAVEDIPKAELSRLELDRIESKTTLLKDRQNHLEVRSPIAGVILSGSFDRQSSAPVKTGQGIYEVAPIAPIKVEVAVPADDLAQVEPQQSVTLWFEGVDQALTAKIQRVLPQSTTRDGRNVFVAECVLDNEDGQIRPGMHATAAIVTPAHSLYWNLFHKPVSWLRRLTVW